MDQLTLARRAFLGGAIASGALAWGSSAAALLKTADTYPALKAFIEGFVAKRKLIGTMAVVGRNFDAPTVLTAGTIAADSGKRPDLDTIWRLYSMTKPVTGIAAMMLVEQGKLRLDQPIAELIPAFANMNVLATPASALTDVRPAKTQITVRHLLTHTGGLGYNIVQKGPIAQAYTRNGIVPGQVSRLTMPGQAASVPAPSLKEFADRLAKLPLVYEPGTKWSYSVGLDLLGRVIEVASGQAFDAFLASRIFKPLGMTSTWFRVPQSEVGRLATNYAPLGGVLIPIDVASNSIYLDKPAFPFGGAGLAGSARDYDRFLMMLLGEGAIGSTRIMKRETSRLAMSNLLPAGVSTAGTFAQGQGFGAGGRVSLASAPQGAGVFGWGGAAGTIGLVDTRRKIRAGGYAQYMPAEAVPFQSGFPAALFKDVGG